MKSFAKTFLGAVTLATAMSSANATCFGIGAGQPEPFLKRVADQVDLTWLPYTDQVFVAWNGDVHELNRFIAIGQKDVFGTSSLRLRSSRMEARADGDFVIIVDRISGEVVEVEDRDGRPLKQQSCASDWTLAGG